ncbi:stress protein [Pseudoalteromonas tunicata]|jgi:putative membrane protein|nr:stress protein [Pseudoalteromonas tunicata]
MPMNNSVSSHAWQKLSPVAMVYFVLHFIVRFVKDGIMNIAPVFVVFITQVERKLFWGTIGITVLGALLVIYSVLYYLNFRFKVSDHEVILKKGVFKKERITLNFAKIQNINIAVPFYFQPFKLVNCTFDAAGSAKQEVGLPGIAETAAILMRETVFNYKQQQAPLVSAAETVTLEVDELPIFSLKNKEVAKFGLMSSMMAVVLVVAAPFSEHIVRFTKQEFVKPLVVIYQQFVPNAAAGALAIATVVFALVAFFLSVSILGSLLRFYNYQLYFSDGKLKRVAGLLERHQMSLNTNKIQAIEVKQNWVGLFLKRFTLSCKQVENSQYGQAKKGQSFIMPVLNSQQLQQAFDLCWQPCDLKAIPFVPIHSQYLRKNFTLFWLLPGVLVTALLYFFGAGLHWILLLEFLAVGLLLCWLRYKRYGIYSDGEHAFVRTGLIGSQITAFSLYKIQQVQRTQTPMMKRLGLASLQIQLACGKLKVPYLPACLVNQFINIALYQAESSDKNWL